MSRKLLACLGYGLALTASATAAPAAWADGLPVPFDAGDNAGLRSPDGDFSYASVGVGNNTAALRIATAGGEIQRSTELRGDFGIPLVAYDATPSGLSADGKTLVLLQPRIRFPRAETTFVELDAERLRLRQKITLQGDLSFDALSPDGRLMYLIRYFDPRDPTAYAVRAYDLQRGKLLPDPIVDPDETGEEMAGFPQTRTTSSNGRWAYTLYSSAERDHPPFIHALDTKRITAVCIDLDSLDSRNLYRFGLQPSADGATLAVVDRGEAVANVDLATFEVSEPSPPAVTTAAASDDQGGAPWSVIGAGSALVLIAGTAMLIRRRRRRPPDDENLERLVGVDEPADDEQETRECEPVR